MAARLVPHLQRHRRPKHDAWVVSLFVQLHLQVWPLGLLICPVAEEIFLALLREICPSTLHPLISPGPAPKVNLKGLSVLSAKPYFLSHFTGNVDQILLLGYARSQVNAAVNMGWDAFLLSFSRNIDPCPVCRGWYRQPCHSGCSYRIYGTANPVPKIFPPSKSRP